MFSTVSKVSAIAIILVAVVVSTGHASKMLQQSGTGSLSSAPTKKGQSEMSALEAMMSCNESFRTSEEFLQELNQTGSFPDESDKTPMCFLKCYLEKMAILSDEGDINEEKVIQMFPTVNNEGIDDCKKEMDHTNNVCEKVYFLVRCVMTRVLVDGRSTDNK
ncbi:General odorant-binding protein 84a [Sergentomyia squamirostris]